MCVQWEQQRIQQQKQVAELEVESKRLHEELTLSSVRPEVHHPAMTHSEDGSLMDLLGVFFSSCCPLIPQAQQELFKQEQQEHRASYLEVQRLRTQLEVAQGRIHSQDLEVERLHALESQLEQKQREQQVSNKRMLTCIRAKYLPLEVAMAAAVSRKMDLDRSQPMHHSYPFLLLLHVR